jgi:hypothetical protein
MLLLTVVVLLLVTCLSPATGLLNRREPHYTEEEKQTWIEAVELFGHLAHPHKQSLIYTLNQIIADDKIKITPACRISLRDFASGVSTGNLTQMLMFDSFSKPLGIMSAQGFNLGSHRQCLKQGRYVLFGIRFPMPEDESITKLDPLPDGEVDVLEEWMLEYSKMIGFFRGYPFYGSICVPDACHEDDIVKVFNSNLVIDQIDPLRLTLESSESYSDDWNITFMQVIVFLAITSLTNTTGLATVMNYFFPDHDIAKLLKPFDLVANFVHLWSDREENNNSSNSLTSAFDLFRVMHLMFGFFCHVIFGMSSILLFRTQVFTSSYTPLLEEFFKGIPVSAGFTLVISACLSCYSWLTITKKSGSSDTSFLRFALPKLLRPLPVMAFIILFYTSFPIMNHIGPMGKLVQADSAVKCFDNGWRELSFISNFYPVSDACNIVNWLVAVDVQLCLASFLILFLMSKNMKAGLFLLLAAIAAGMIASGIFSVNNNLSVYLNLNIDQVYNTITKLHLIMYHTIHYVPVYGIGMLLGYVLFLQDGKKWDIPDSYLVASVIPLASLTTFSAVAYDEDYVFYFGPFAEMIYTTMARSLSAICCCILFYAFLNTSNPIVTYISDSKIIIVASRLSYCMFACHSVFINIILSSLETQVTTTLFLVLMYFSVLFFGFVFANFLYIYVEAPFRQVFKRLLRASDESKKLKSS